MVAVKVALLALSLLAAAPHGAALAAPDDAPPPAAAPPVVAPPAAAPSAPAPLPVAPPSPAPLPAVPPAPTTPATIGPPSQAAPATRSVKAAESEPGELSPQLAFSLSFLMPIALVAGSVAVLDVDGGGGIVFLVSLVAGPSSGWFYAGKPITGLATATTRLAGLYLFSSVLDDRPGAQDGRIAVGALMVITATLIDWIGPPVAVSNHNARVRARATLVPTAQPGGAGLSLVGSF